MESAKFIGQWHNASLRHLAISRFRSNYTTVSAYLIQQGVIDAESSDKLLRTFESNGIIEWFALHPQFAQPYPQTNEAAFVDAAADSVDILLTARYSKEFRMAMGEIIQSVLTVVSFDDFVTNAEAKFNIVTDRADADAVQLVLSIFSHSRDYWDETGVQKLKPGTWVIIADGVGGLIGSLGGAGGAIILGCLTSALTNEYYN